MTRYPDVSLFPFVGDQIGEKNTKLTIDTIDTTKLTINTTDNTKLTIDIINY